MVSRKKETIFAPQIFPVDSLAARKKLGKCIPRESGSSALGLLFGKLLNLDTYVRFR